MENKYEAFLQHGEWGGPYRTEQVLVKLTSTPQRRSVSGYGSRLPTHYMVFVEHRWRRVYAVCWSNVSTLYIGSSKAQGIVVQINQVEG